MNNILIVKQIINANLNETQNRKDLNNNLEAISFNKMNPIAFNGLIGRVTSNSFHTNSLTFMVDDFLE